MPLPEGKERGYILPVDADPNNPIVTAISTDQLNELLEAIYAKHLYVVMDACYGGLIFTRSQPLSPETQNFIEVISTRRARQAITASGRDQPVFDTDPGGHSVFTFHFIQGLETMSADLDKNGVITASEIASYIMPRVTAESRGQQTPQYGILVGDRGGEFYFILRPRVSSLEIVSNPGEADVFVDDRFVGKTPTDVDIYEFGEIKVVVKKDGYLDYEAVVDITEGYHELRVKLEKAGFLSINSMPLGAEVYINGKSVGKTPLVLPKMKREKYQVKLTLANYQDFEETVNLQELERVDLNVTLEKMKSKLTIFGMRGEADVTIRSDESNSKQVFKGLPLRNLSLTYGRYEIVVEKVGYHKFRRSIELVEPEVNIPIRLEPKSKMFSLFLSALIPGAGQIYMGRVQLGL